MSLVMTRAMREGSSMLRNRRHRISPGLLPAAQTVCIKCSQMCVCVSYTRWSDWRVKSAAQHQNKSLQQTVIVGKLDNSFLNKHHRASI